MLQQYWRVLAALALSMLLIVVGCDDDGDGGRRTTADTGALEGHVVQVNPVFLVSSPEDAPAGADVQQNAVVQAIDESGMLVGASVSGPDGFFHLDGLPRGFVRLETRLALGTGAPDLESRFSLVADDLFAFDDGIVDPDVDRAEAISIALVGVSADALVVGTLNPLPRGTRIEPAGEVLGDRAESLRRILPRAEWLFFIDFEPFQRYGHATQLRFVDAETGALTVVGAEYYPLVNGQPLWSTSDELFDFGALPQDFDVRDLEPADLPDVEPIPTPEVVQLPPVPNTAFDPLDGVVFDPDPSVGPHDSVFAILVQGSAGLGHAFDLNAMADRLAEIGVPAENVRTVFYKTTRFGATKPQELLERELQDAIREINAEITLRHNQSGGAAETTLIYFHSSDGSPESVRLGQRELQAADLLFDPRLRIGDTRACRLYLLFEAPYTGVLAADLRAAMDARPRRFRQDVQILVATGNSQTSGYGGLAATLLGYRAVAGSFWTRAVAGQFSIVGGEVIGLADLDLSPPPLLGALPDLRNDPAGTPQNPQLLLAGDNENCEPGVANEPHDEEPLLGRSAVEFVNETDASLRVKLEAVGEVINNDAAFLLPAGDRVRLDFAGPLDDLTIAEIVLSGNRTIEDLGRFDVQEGTEVVMRLRKRGGADVLVIEHLTLEGLLRRQVRLDP